jgi:hypothetical protein
MDRFPVLFTCLLTTLLLVGGCGKKTPPLPPQSVVPAAISDLRYELDLEGVTLSWNWPRRTEKGGELRRIKQFIVERAEESADDFCPDCPRRYRQVGLVEGGPVPDRNVAQPLSFRDRDLRPGYHYSYRVRSSLGWRVISTPSEAVTMVWQVGLAAPENLTARAGEREVTLDWRAPERDLEGMVIREPLSYQVFRREVGQPFLLLGEVQREPGYVDRRVSSGVNYEYRVRASRVSGGTGAFSTTVAATPRDLTPPPAPTGLTAVVSRAEVHLYWQPLVSDDLAGYRIYRRRQIGGGDNQWVLIGQVDGRANTYIDSTPFSQAGEVRYYSLRAFDHASPPNVSDSSEEIETSTTSMTP